MIFLIEYDRGKGEIVSLCEFEASRRREAEDARLAIEVKLNGRGMEHEVVLLEAKTLEDLRRTHERYFKSLRQILVDKVGLV